MWCTGRELPILECTEFVTLSMGHLDKKIWATLGSCLIVRLSQVVFGLVDEGEDACGGLPKFFHSDLQTAAKTYIRIRCLLQVGISKVKWH